MLYLIAPCKKPLSNWYIWACPRNIKQNLTILTPETFKVGGVPDDCTGLILQDLESIKHLRTLTLHQDLLWEEGSGFTHKKLIGMFNIIYLMDSRSIPLTYVPSMVAMNSPMSGDTRVIYNRIMRKFLPDQDKYFVKQPKLDYKYLDANTSYIKEVEEFGTPMFIACDLETLQNVIFKLESGEERRVYAVIDLASWSAVYNIDGEYVIKTWVVPFKKEHHYTRFGELMTSSYAKGWHNGNYDKSYLLRWKMPPVNSIWDTQYYPQSVTSDLTGSYNLASQHALNCRYSKYWKGLANWKVDRSTDDKSYYPSFCRYSALDTHNGAELMLTQLLQFNKQNLVNFILKTQFLPVTTLATMENLFINPKTRDEMAIETSGRKYKAMDKVQDIFGCKFNSGKLVGAVKAMATVANMMEVPEVPKVNKADKLTLKMLRGANSWYDYVLGQVASVRLATNWMSTYISVKTVQDSKDRTVFMASFGSYLTQSLRFNSSESHFWIGTNAQNVPKALRSMFEPPKGYVLVASDAPQSESYTTGYESNCKEMLEILEDPEVDWHKNTASICFGVPYKDIDKALRTLAKPVGHGFNYNMKGYALLMNMGLENARRVRVKNGYPSDTPLVKVTGALIKSLSDKYWTVRNVWYLQQASKVVRLGRLPCKTGFAPAILQDIQYDVNVLNSIVSLAPQHLSAYLNVRGALSAVLHQLYVDSSIRYLMQIHDENVFLVPENKSIREVDAYILKHFTNSTSYPQSPKGHLSIPVGIPVVGDTWGDLSHDEIDREGLDLDAPISSLTPRNRKKENQ